MNDSSSSSSSSLQQPPPQRPSEDYDNSEAPSAPIIPEWKKRIRTFWNKRRIQKVDMIQQPQQQPQQVHAPSKEDIPPEDWKKLLTDNGSREEMKQINITTFHKQFMQHSKKTAEFINWKDDQYGRTMLYCAIRYKRLDIAKVLLEHGANVHVTDKRGMTALMWASYYGYTEMVQFLMNKGADRTVASHRGDTALSIACQCGHTETVKLLIDNDKGMMTVTTGDAERALLIAARRGHNEIIKLFFSIDNKGVVVVDIKTTADKNGDTALMIASRCGNTDTVKLLIDHSGAANIKIANYDGDTALSLAYHEGHDPIVDFLLTTIMLLQDSSADDETNNTTTIPVQWAKMILKRNEFVYIDMDTFLARWMEHPNLPSFINWKDDFIEKGRTMLHCAIWYKRLDIAKLLLQQEHVINVEIPDKKGNTALMYAAEKGCVEIAKFLIVERGANVHATNNAGKFPLHWACCNGHLEIIILLIDNGANQHIQNIDNDEDNGGDNNNKTPPPLYFYGACERGDLDVAKLLLSRGANVHVKTEQGSTALQVAAERNHPEIVWFLVNQYPGLILEGGGGLE